MIEDTNLTKIPAKVTVYDMCNRPICEGDTIIYGVSAGSGSASISVYKVLGWKLWPNWHIGQEPRYSLTVTPIEGSQYHWNDIPSLKPRQVDFPENCLIISGTDVEKQLFAHFEKVKEEKIEKVKARIKAAQDAPRNRRTESRSDTTGEQ